MRNRERNESSKNLRRFKTKIKLMNGIHKSIEVPTIIEILIAEYL